MPTALRSFPLRKTRRLPWRPMTDAEWEALHPVLRRSTRGRPPADLRRIWDGIFWVACSTGPWSAMPEAFGKPDTAHCTLRRAARARRLHVMLMHVSPHPRCRDSGLRGIAWFVVRAYRRAFRALHRAVGYARMLGMESALPADPWWCPKPLLSERLDKYVEIARAWGRQVPLWWLRWVGDYAKIVGGDPRRWRTTG